jgi:type I restriction enzyme M protein
VILTNPPFGGEIRDEAILQEYELAKNNQRHILFIERIIHLLKPGGRAALVVPQGILNNTNLAGVREWLFKKTRIIGVIGLDANTFKPHTNVKTSLLFFQKWQGQTLVDYPVFMAVSQKSGKNLSGKLIAHDLNKITKNFREFIKKEKLNF